MAPSVYLDKIINEEMVTSSVLDSYLESHWLDSGKMRDDEFEGFIIERAKSLLDAVSAATGKAVTGRDSEEVIKSFGSAFSLNI